MKVSDVVMLKLVVGSWGVEVFTRSSLGVEVDILLVRLLEGTVAFFGVIGGFADGLFSDLELEDRIFFLEFRGFDLEFEGARLGILRRLYEFLYIVRRKQKENTKTKRKRRKQS